MKNMIAFYSLCIVVAHYRLLSGTQLWSPMPYQMFKAIVQIIFITFQKYVVDTGKGLATRFPFQ